MKRGDMIKVNIHEAKTKLSGLLLAVEKKGELVRICRDGKPVAELRAVKKSKNPFKVNPRLRVRFKADPMLPLDEEDWSEPSPDR